MTPDPYEHITRTWREACSLPSHIRDTPNWEAGMQVLNDWVEGFMPARGRGGKPIRPARGETWAFRVHVFSHYVETVLGFAGHGERHAAREAEGQKVVLDWWYGG